MPQSPNPKVGTLLPVAVFNSCYIELENVHNSHVKAFEEVEGNLKSTGTTSGCCANSCVVWGRWGRSFGGVLGTNRTLGFQVWCGLETSFGLPLADSEAISQKTMSLILRVLEFAKTLIIFPRYLWCANLGDCRAVYIPLNSYQNGDKLEIGKKAEE